MHHLKVGPSWAEQISEIRNAHTDETSLIRFGNNSYRTCRDTSDAFEVVLSTSIGDLSHPLHLQVRESDFYITAVGGKPMERYASTFNMVSPSAGNLDHAVHTLARNESPGSAAFNLRSLVVFCIAESLRNDHLATALEQTIRASTMRIGGIDRALDINTWWRMAHQWGQASDAIHRIVPSEAIEKRLATYVDIDKLPEHLRRCAATTKVLKRRG